MVIRRHFGSFQALVYRNYVCGAAPQPVPCDSSKQTTTGNAKHSSPLGRLRGDVQEPSIVVAETEDLNIADEQGDEDADQAGPNTMQH